MFFRLFWKIYKFLFFWRLTRHYPAAFTDTLWLGFTEKGWFNSSGVPNYFTYFFWRFIIHYSAKRYGHTTDRFYWKRLVQHCGQILLKADWFSIVGRLLKILVQLQLCPMCSIYFHNPVKFRLKFLRKRKYKYFLFGSRCDNYNYILFYIYTNIFTCIFYCIVL